MRTVSVEVPEPLVTESGLSAQVAGRVTAGVTAQVKLTVLLKPFVGAIVIVEVAVPPAFTAAGVRVEAAMVKSGTGAEVTVRARGVV